MTALGYIHQIQTSLDVIQKHTENICLITEELAKRAEVSKLEVGESAKSNEMPAFPVLRKVNQDQQNIRDGANLKLNPMRDSSKDKALEFYFWLPKDWDPKFQYSTDKDFKWPVIIFLHGSDIRGQPLTSLKNHSLPCWIDQSMKTSMDKKEDCAEYSILPSKLPFAVLAPRCSGKQLDGFRPMFAKIFAKLDELAEKFPIDASRVCATGLSMGGKNTWDIALDFPNRLRAIAPVCGGHREDALESADTIKHIKAWVFHGDRDGIVQPEEAQAMAEALRKAGGTCRFTLMPGKHHHDLLQEVYENLELYQWFHACCL